MCRNKGIPVVPLHLYRIVTLVEYQTVNPGQDFDDHEAALFQPPEAAETADQVERPNVAAIAMQEAMRTTAGGSSGMSEKKIEEEGTDGRLDTARTEQTVEQQHVSDQELLERTGHAHS
jgi:aquaporin related protein